MSDNINIWVAVHMVKRQGKTGNTLYTCDTKTEILTFEIQHLVLLKAITKNSVKTFLTNIGIVNQTDNRLSVL